MQFFFIGESLMINSAKYYFNVKLEFEKSKVDQIIHDTILNKGRGYICSVESNVMATANSDEIFRKIVNGALVNICDGSFVARTIGWAYGKKFETIIGANLFIEYIAKRKYTQYFLGNTTEVLSNLQINLSKIDPRICQMPFVTLPFLAAEDFNYREIAVDINKHSPDIIWVSLGAPKQEIFMHNLLPYLNKGIMFGFGAIFNFYSELKGQERAPEILLKYKLEWLYRLFQSPKKTSKRILAYLKKAPRLIIEEKIKSKSK